MAKARVLYTVSVDKGELEYAVAALTQIPVTVGRTSGVKKFPYGKHDITRWHVSIEFPRDGVEHVEKVLQELKKEGVITEFWSRSRE